MAFPPDIAPSRMFTTNWLCSIVCPIHEWPQFFLIFLKVIFLLSPFVELKNAYDLVRREILYNIRDALGICM
jgi:hypothetical protein